MYIETNVVYCNVCLLQLLRFLSKVFFFSNVTMLFTKIACDCEIHNWLQLVRQLYSPEYIL